MAEPGFGKGGFHMSRGGGKVRPVCERLHAKQAAISRVAPKNAVVGRAYREFFSLYVCTRQEALS